MTIQVGSDVVSINGDSPPLGALLELFSQIMIMNILVLDTKLGVVNN